MGMGKRLAAGPVSEIVGTGSALIVGTPQAQRAVDVLSAMHGIDGAERHPDGVLVHPDGVAASAVVAALVGAGIPVERVTPNRRLEDAFLALIAGPAGAGTSPSGGPRPLGDPVHDGDPVHGSGKEQA
jgi:ABC-2 type transport system ATP-binding protein